MSSKLKRHILPIVHEPRIDSTERRPRTRGECVNGVRPCPWVGCVHHLYLDLIESGTQDKILALNCDPTEMHESCSLDVADEGEHTIYELEEILSISHQRVSQIVARALPRLADALPSDCGAGRRNGVGPGDTD